MNGTGKPKNPSEISEVLFDKIKSNRMTDLKTNELLQSAYENCNSNIQFIQKIMNLVSVENTLLKKFIDSEGLYGKFVDYAEGALDELVGKLEERQ